MSKLCHIVRHLSNEWEKDLSYFRGEKLAEYEKCSGFVEGENFSHHCFCFICIVMLLLMHIIQMKNAFEHNPSIFVLIWILYEFFFVLLVGKN